MAAAAAAAAIEGEFHVLAVDDSLIDRKLIERLLKISSFQVTTVDSGSKALEFLGKCPSPDDYCCCHTHQQLQVQVNLIITDYCMPHMTGYDLLKKLKESSSLRNIPVVIMSSENVPSRITRCLEEGAEEFLLKPVTLADVNRLKPHMLRANKYGLQQHDCQKPTQHQHVSQQNAPQDQQLIKQKHDQQEQQQNISKRKSMEVELSPTNNTRPRFSSLTTVI